MDIEMVVKDLISHISVSAFMTKIAYRDKQYGVANRWEASMRAYQHSLEIIKQNYESQHMRSRTTQYLQSTGR